MKDDERRVRKNKPLPVSELPDWARAFPAEELERYIHSPQCRVCNATTHNGRNLRSEIEALVIERKTHTEVCNIMYERYRVRLSDHNISRHMARHAPDYAKVLGKLLESDLGEVLQGAFGPVVDQYKFLLAVLQLALHKLLLHPEEVSIADGIRAAEKFDLMTRGLDIWQRDNALSQEHITKWLDMMQIVMTPEQRKEVRGRFDVAFIDEPVPELPPPV